MCGIVTVVRPTEQNTAKTVFKAYNKQATRGTEGYGFVSAKSDGTLVAYQRTQTLADIRTLLQKNTSNVVMFHHRLPTSVPNIAGVNHPIVVKNETLKHDYYVVHNGVISNDTERKSIHNKLGFSYTTELKRGWCVNGEWYEQLDSVEYNDSEALAIDLARYIDGKTRVVDSVGAAAYVVMQFAKQSGKLKAIHYGRNASNPLYETHLADGSLLITSENVHRTGTSVPIDQLRTITVNGQLKRTVDLKVAPYSYSRYASTYYGSYNPPQQLEKQSKLDVYSSDYGDLEAEANELKQLIAVADTCIADATGIERADLIAERNEYKLALASIDNQLTNIYRQHYDRR